MGRSTRRQTHTRTHSTHHTLTQTPMNSCCETCHLKHPQHQRFLTAHAHLCCPTSACAACLERHVAGTKSHSTRGGRTLPMLLLSSCQADPSLPLPPLLLLAPCSTPCLQPTHNRPRKPGCELSVPAAHTDSHARASTHSRVHTQMQCACHRVLPSLSRTPPSQRQPKEQLSPQHA